MYKTLLKSIIAWQCNNKYSAYQYYLLDEGKNEVLNFDEFCLKFPEMVKRHQENEEAEKLHSRANLCLNS